MDLTKLFQGPVIGEQGELPAPQVSVEMLHTPDGSLHFQQKGSVITLMFLQLSAGIGNHTVLPVGINLGQDGSQASRLFVIS
jgi:hypothetical protein